MPYIFTVFFFAGLVLLVLGLFSPAKALWWYKGEKTRSRVGATYLLLIIFSLAGIAITAPDVEQSKDTVVQAFSKPADSLLKKPRDYDTFSYPLPQSEYVFSIQISRIDTKVVKDAFTHKDDQYSPEKKVDGYKLNVSFKMTNPYDKVLIVPVPRYHYIGTLDKRDLSLSTTYHRDCECAIDNSSKLTDTKGKEVSVYTVGGCGYSDPCVQFQPHETKEFVIRFTDPIYYDVQQLILGGFNRYGQSANSTRRRDIVLLLDIANKKVIDEIQL